MFGRSRTFRRRRPVAGQIRLRRWVRVALLLVVLGGGGSAVLDRAGWFKYRGDDWAHFDKQACEVVSVADGDTLTLRRPGGGEPTRPPARHRRAGTASQGGDGPAHGAERAKSYLAARTRGRDIIVRLDQTQTRDHYGRLLAYLYLNEGDNLNLDLVRDGRATRIAASSTR